MRKNKLIKVQGTQEFMGKEIPVIVGGFGEDNKVVTDKMVAEIHNMKSFHVRENINKNIKRFKRDIDIIDLKKVIDDTDNNILLTLGYTNMEISKANNIYLLSERGYSKLIKIMDTDLAWDIHDKLMDDYFKLRETVKNGRTQKQSKQVDTKEKETEARLINAKVRQANMYLKIAEKVNISTYKDICYSKATEALNGEALLPLPKAERRTYSAAEIGEKLGITANKVGSLANRYNLKTEEYGLMVWDKSKYSNKQVEAFRYYENVIPVLKDILEEESA